jgi:RNA polymerase sigma factor (sigma-70 family)
MAQPLTRLLHHLRRRSAPPGPASDADLLDRFARLRDESAFAALVSRHGPMVLNVCRRVLSDAHAAEDAAQAAFLVLARKAGSLRRPDALAGWLHGVACRVALKARSSRPRDEGLGGAEQPADPRPGPLATVLARDLLAALEQEVQRLPEAHRLVVVLCCLEGLSQEEAAARLGCTSGAIKGRLERGRQRLHQRLEKRGLSLSAVLGVAEVARVVGGIPAALLSSTVDAAAPFAAGQAVQGASSAQAAAWAEGVVKAMFLTKLKIVLTALLTLAVAGTAIGVLTLEARSPAPVVPVEPKTGKDIRRAAFQAKIRKLQLERRDWLKKEVEARRQEFLAGRGTLEHLLKTYRVLLQAELDVATTAQERIAAHAAHREVVQEAEELCEKGYNAGRVKAADFFQARATRLEAEIGWLKAGGKEKANKGKDEK